jgi:hypothetical protein
MTYSRLGLGVVTLPSFNINETFLALSNEKRQRGVVVIIRMEGTNKLLVLLRFRPHSFIGVRMAHSNLSHIDGLEDKSSAGVYRWICIRSPLKGVR